MKIFSHLIYQLVLIFFLIKKIPFNSIKKKYNKNSSNVIWLFPQFPFGFFRYFGSAAIFQDAALIYSLVNEIDDFRIFIGPKIGKLRNINFFYSFTDKFNPFGFESNSRFLSKTLSILENQGCKLFPKLQELELWEDKKLMYEKFEKFDIPFPRTTIIDTFEEESKIFEKISEHNFPLLIKEHFGNHSKGIFHISNIEEFKTKLKKLKARKVTNFAVQELLNDDNDYRIIVIGNKVVQTYRRDKKESKEWVTTSTSNGSVIDFSSIGQELENKFIDFNKDLNLTNAAYDASIANSKIIVFEVSSSYLTNPEPPKNFLNKPYINFKKSLLEFPKSRVEIVFSLRSLWVKEQLKN